MTIPQCKINLLNCRIKSPRQSDVAWYRFLCKNNCSASAPSGAPCSQYFCWPEYPALKLSGKKFHGSGYFMVEAKKGRKHWDKIFYYSLLLWWRSRKYKTNNYCYDENLPHSLSEKKSQWTSDTSYSQMIIPHHSYLSRNSSYKCQFCLVKVEAWACCFLWENWQEFSKWTKIKWNKSFQYWSDNLWSQLIPSAEDHFLNCALPSV